MSRRYTINLISWQSEVYYRKSERTTTPARTSLSFFIESFLCSFSKVCLHLPMKRGSLFEDNTDKLTSKHISSGEWGLKVQEWAIAATCFTVAVTEDFSLVNNLFY